MNRDTAVSQQMMNMIGQNNPWGSTSYSQTGTGGYTDSQGRWVSIPQYTQTTTFSPEQQRIFDLTQGAQTNLAGLAQDQSAMLRDYLGQPFEYNNHDAENWAFDLASQRLIPEQGRQNDALRGQLVNSGLRPGTAAYDMEMKRMQQGHVGQLNDLALSGRQQGFAEALAQRNQPINEITALLSGSQVSNPAQMSGPTPQTSVAGVDYSGMVNQRYQSQMAQHNAMMGGLFGLAGSIGSAALMPSDRRIKTGIERVGRLDNGLPVYRFKYLDGGPVQIGLMAQDVEAVHPAAVTEVGGVKHVDYAKAVR